MYIIKCYKYKFNGIVYISGNVPEDATILETMNVLNAEDGYELVRIADSEKVGNSVWLRDNDSPENYEEIEIINEDNSNSKIN